MLSLHEMTSKTCLRLVSGLLLTGLLGMGMSRLADGLAGAVDGLLLADVYNGQDPSPPNHGQNEGGKPPPNPANPKAVPDSPVG